MVQHVRVEKFTVCARKLELWVSCSSNRKPAIWKSRYQRFQWESEAGHAVASKPAGEDGVRTLTHQWVSASPSIRSNFYCHQGFSCHQIINEYRVSEVSYKYVSSDDQILPAQSLLLRFGTGDVKQRETKHDFEVPVDSRVELSPRAVIGRTKPCGP